MNTNLNISWFNSSNTQMYINPANNRQLDYEFDPATLNFTWAISAFTNETMYVNLVFD